MSNLELFVIGLGVTLLMIVALGPLVVAAILDGRYNDEMQAVYRQQRSRASTGAAPREEGPPTRAG